MSVIFSGASLIALPHLLQFTAAYVVLALIPGYALATVARPTAPRLERLALTIPCAYSLVAVSGLVTLLVHTSFGLAPYALLAIPLVAAAAYVTWKRGRPADKMGRWWIAAAATASVQGLATLLVNAPNVMPVGYDLPVHAMWTNQILQTHTFPLSLMASRVGANDGPFYPAAFHALTALLLTAAPMPTPYGLFFSAVFVTVAFPVALFSYVHIATSSARLGALASIASLAFEAAPTYSIEQGLYPVTLALLFTPALAITLHDALGKGDRRSALLATLLGIGLLYTHPTEFGVAAIALLGVVPAALHGPRSWLRAAGYTAAITAVWIAAISPARAAMHSAVSFATQSSVSLSSESVPAAQRHLSTAISSYIHWIYGRNVGYLLLVFVIIGAVSCVLQRRYRGLLLTLLIVAALFIDGSTLNLVAHLHAISFHWTELDRLVPAHYWFVLPIAAIGMDAVARGLGRVAARRSTAYAVLIASPLILLGVLLPLGVTVGRLNAYSQVRRSVAAADLGSLAWLAAHAPAQTVVLNEEDRSRADILDESPDAGVWLQALGGPQPTFFRQTVGPGPFIDRLYVLGHIADLPQDTRVANYVAHYHLRYVFYGSQISPLATRHLQLSRLLTDPHLRLVYSSADSCLHALTTPPSACPAKGSYVFALRGETLP